MNETLSSQTIVPGRSVGFLTLGASLHDILNRLKTQPQTYPALDVTYSSTDPVALPILVSLPKNGLRLRFDGPDQRLRLIEVTNFARTRLRYREDDIFKLPEQLSETVSLVTPGPSFRHIYKLFGPSQPGEFIKAADSASLRDDIYVVSYPGVAFSYPLKHSAHGHGTDVTKINNVLMNYAASAASSMSIFSGHSWPSARRTLFVAEPPNPRSLALSHKGKEVRPAEIELARVHGEGQVELVRKNAEPFWIVLSQTSPQDLITELGPPESMYKKVDRRSDIHKQQVGRARRHSVSPARPGSSSGTDYASSHTEDSEDEHGDMTNANRLELEAAETFYNYYSHGFDILVSRPTSISPAIPSAAASKPASVDDRPTRASVLALNSLTATKVIFHGNIPGSYTFNRHRRSRWTLQHVGTGTPSDAIDSESNFNTVHSRLETIFESAYASREEQRIQQEPMSVHREVGDSPSSSCELIGGLMEGMHMGTDSAERGSSSKKVAHEKVKVLGDTQIWPFPGMLFEVLENGAISALTIF